MVEIGSNFILVNGHGVRVPIPDGYDTSDWAARIAEAMLYRNLTWVHVGGYPFYSYWLEGENKSREWGIEGFQQLMKHIGKGNITCKAPARAETVKVSMDTSSMFVGLPREEAFRKIVAHICGKSTYSFAENANTR